MLPKQPIVHMLDVGEDDPAGNPNHPYNQLVNYYAIYGHNIVGMRTALKRGGHDYESERNREVDPFDRFGWGYVGDGYHNITRYGELEDDAVRRDSLGVVMRSTAVSIEPHYASVSIMITILTSSVVMCSQIE